MSSTKIEVTWYVRWFSAEVLVGLCRRSRATFIGKHPRKSTMRLFLARFMAVPTAAGTTAGLKPAPIALLPPIPLYRRLLRAHRHKLAEPERLLGDEYVKAEFRRHRKVENPLHIVCCQMPLNLPAVQRY